MNFKNYITPYKYGKPVITGSGIKGEFDFEAVDCPFVFKHNGRFHMTYVGYDGYGYSTALAVSDDLINWEKLGVILGKKTTDAWDRTGCAGTWIIKESNSLFGPYDIKKINGRYWLAYQAYPGEGYEYGAGSIGLAWCENDNLLEWNTLSEPILYPGDGMPWEKGGLYKACVFEANGRFYLFYNAKNNTFGSWIEQTGFAVSDDLTNWYRYSGNPVMKVIQDSWQSIFCCDPCIYSIPEGWLMYYYGFDGKNARNGIAFSKNLVEWERHSEPILDVGKPGELDYIHAHKPSLIFSKGNLYQFYCACRPYEPGDRTRIFKDEFRCITVASSVPF